MKRFVGVAIAAMLLSGCVRTTMTSFVDPAQRGAPKYQTIAVMGVGLSLQERDAFEKAGVASLAKVNVKAISGLEILPPTRNWTTQDIANVFQKNGVQAVLYVEDSSKGTEHSYVPPTYTPGQTYVTTQNYGYFSTFQVNQTPSTYTPGYTISKPRASYKVNLMNAQNGAMVWAAEAESRGAAADNYSDMSKALAEKAVTKLKEDGLI